MVKIKPFDGPTGPFEPLTPDTDSGLDAYKQESDRRFKEIENITRAILFVAVISLVGVVVAVVGIFIDQVHFNYQTYSQNQEQRQERHFDKR